MKRVWGFGREKGMSPLGSASGLQRQGRGVGQKNNRIDNLLLGYHVQDRDLRKIHKAACVGNAAQVQQILFLGGSGVDDRDKMNSNYEIICRHKEEIMLKNSLQNSNPGSDEKAEKDSITRLSDTPVPDDSWSTSASQDFDFGTKSMSEKPNKDVPHFSGAVDQKGQTTLNGQVEGSDKNAEEDSITRLSNKPGPDDSWPTSSSQVLHFGTKNVPKSRIAKLLHSSWQFIKNMRPKRGTMKPGDGTLSEDNNPHSENKDMAETLSKPPVRVYGDPLPVLPSSKSLLKPSLKTLAVLGLAKSMSEKPNKDVPHFSGAVDQKGQTTLNGQVEGSDEKAEEGSITRLSDTSVPDDSWSTSASQDFDFGTKSMSEKPNKDVPLFSGAVDQKGQSILNGQVEGSDEKTEEDSITRLSDTSVPDDSWSTSASQDFDFGTKSMSEKPNKDVPLFSGAVDQKGQSILNGQVEGSDEKTEEDSITRLSDTSVPDDSWSTSASQDFDFGTKSMSEKPNKDVPLFSGAVDQKGQSILNGQVEGPDEKTEEDSITRLSDTSVPDDSWSTSASQDFDFGTKSMSEKPNKDVPLFSGAVDQKGQSILNGQVEGSDEKTEEDSITRLSDTSVPDDSWSTSASQDFDFGTKSMSEKPNKDVPLFSGAVDQKGQSILNGQVEGSDEKTEEDSITRLSDTSVPDDSWSTSASQDFDFGTKSMSEKPNKDVPLFSGAVDQKGQSILNGQVEGSDEKTEEDSITRLSDTSVPDDSWSTSASQDFDFGTKSMSEKPNKDVPLFSGAVDQKGQSILNGQVEGSDKNAEEDSITRLSNKPGPDDSWPTSSSQVLHFGTKNVPKSRIAKLLHSSWQFIKNMRPKRGTMKPGDGTLSEDNNPHSENKDMAETLSKPPVRVYGDPLPVLPSSKSLLKPSLKTLAVLGLAKSMSEKPNKDVPHFSGPVDQKGQTTLNGQVEGSDEKAEEGSITRLSDTPVPDDSWSTSASQDFDFGTKSMSEKPNKDVPHFSGPVDQKGQTTLNGQVEGSDEKAEKGSITRLSDTPVPDDSWSTSASQDFDFGTKERTAKSAMEAKEDGVGIIENVPPEQTVNDSLTSAGGVHKNYRSDMMSALELGEEEDVESPSVPEYQVPLKVEEKRKHRGSDMEVSENIHDAVAAGLIPQRQNRKTDNHQLPITENKDSDRREPGLHMKKLKKGENEKGTSKGSVITPVLQKADSLTGGPLQKNDGSHISEKDQHESRPAKEISKKKNKVKKQITSMDDLVDLIQSSEAASEHCELPYSKNFMLLIEQLGMDCKDYAGFLKIQDIRVSYEKLRKLNKNHCKLLMGKMTKMDKMVSALQNELQEAKDMISWLEHQKVEWEREFCSLRCTLKQEEEEERRNADMLYENIREKLIRKEDEYKKEVETKQQVELALRMLNTELKATKNQVVEERSDTQWQLSPEQKARVLQDGSLNNLFCKQKELEVAHKKTNSKVVVRQLQQELADTLKKKSMSEASPEVTSYLRLEDETRDLKKKLGQIRSQLQEEQERHGEAVRYAEEMKDHVQKLQVKNATQETTIKHQAAQIQDLENNVIKTSLLQEAQERHAEAVRYAEKIKDHMLKLKVKNARQEATIKHQAAQIQDLQSNLLKASLLQEAQERHAEAVRYAEKIKDHMLKLKVKNARQEATIKHQAAQIQDLQSNLLKASLLQEAQERHAEAVRYAEKIKDHMLKLKVKNARQEATIKHQAAQIQDLQSNLLKASLLQEAKDREAKDISYAEKTLEVQNARQEVTIKQQAAQIHNLPSNLLKTSLLQEAQERHAEAVRYAEKIKDHMLKLKVKNARQEATIKHQAAQIQDLQSNLLKASLLQEAKDREAKDISYAEKTLEVQNARQEVTIKQQAAQIHNLPSNLLKTSLLQEAKDREAKDISYAEKTLEVQNARQEVTIKQQAAQIHNLPSNLLKTSLLQEAKDREAKDISYAEKTLEVQNARQEVTIKQQAAQIHNLPSNLLKTSLADVLTTELETTSSKCLHLDAKNQVLQQELLSMKAFKEECEKLESNNKKLQQEVVKLKQFMEMNMVERSQVEQYKREIEERARLDIVEKLHEVNLFLQAQAAARQNLDQLRENDHASTRSQMELRIKDLESQVSTMKTSQEDSTKTELETYRQLYLEELKLRKSLRNKLNRAKERLSESNTKFVVERQQHQTLLRTLTMSPGLEPPYCGHFENNLVLNGNLTTRGNLVIPTLKPRPSYDDRETSLWKTRQELEERITRELEEAATEFEWGSCRTPLVSTDDSILNQDPVWKASREYVQILNKNYMI